MSRLDASLAPYVEQKWIENINILLVRRSQSSLSSSFDYEVCLPESDQILFTTGFFEYFGRRPRRAYLPNDVLRFCDFEPAWERFLPTTFDLSPLSNVPILTQNLTRAKMLKKVRGQREDELLPSDVALRIAALRCIFVKTGILLIEPRTRDFSPKTPKYYSKLLKKYQERVKQKPEDFLTLFTELQDYSLRLSAVNEWWNWISPTTVGKIPRYDTLFYFCAIDPESGPESIQNILRTDSEQNWVFLDRFLGQYFSEKPNFVVLPSQLYELMRLGGHKEYSELKHFASERELLGVEQWIPSVSLYADGCVSTLPGDYQYPDMVEMMPSKTAKFNDAKRMQEFHNGKQLNRIEHRSYWCRVFVKDTDDKISFDNTDKDDTDKTTDKDSYHSLEDSAYLQFSLGHRFPLQIDEKEIVKNALRTSSKL